LAFQEKVLGLLQAAVKADEADSGQFAMLKDRVLRQQGKPQVYGTQCPEQRGRQPIASADRGPEGAHRAL